MAEIIPAILPTSYADLEDHVDRVAGLAPVIQIDVTDGHFVPSKTWPYNGVSREVFDDLTEEKIGLPHWDEIDYEIDLMVSDPEKEAEKWLHAGAGRIILHVESSKDLKPIIEKLKGVIGIGIAIDTISTLDFIFPYIHDIDVVQFMGIKKVGFQGEPFDDTVLARISRLREAYPDVTISVDGGVNLDNAQTILKAGADRLVVGSAIWKSENLVDTLRQFQEM